MHYEPFYSPLTIGAVFLPLLIIIALWTIVLKGYALWYAARGGQKWWFIALLVINTLGILEIIYLIWFRLNSSTTHHSRVLGTPAHHSSP
ncbi:MAG TPA: DUF5652 family protein [Candidatus Paceibacterota bacterium]|nr:DUF5652 family protein [Candidatus Paceibacterota bacterium]